MIVPGVPDVRLFRRRVHRHPSLFLSLVHGLHLVQSIDHESILIDIFQFEAIPIIKLGHHFLLMEAKKSFF